MVKIIDVLIQIEGESPAAFKQRIAAAQLRASSEGAPEGTEALEGAIGRATITPDGLCADMKWGQSHEELPANTCVVAWWPLADSRGDFIAVEPDSVAQALRRAQIATGYAAAMRSKYKGAHTGLPGSIHFNFADAILAKDAYALEYLANGMNECAKAAFTAWTGVPLPSQQGATWRAIRAWAGVSDAAEALHKAQHKVQVALKDLQSVVNNAEQVQAWIHQRIQEGCTNLVNQPGRWVLLNDAGMGYDLSRKGSGLAHARGLIAAEIALEKARAAVVLEQGTLPAEELALAA